MQDSTIGPVVSKVQFYKIQALINKGIEEGATLVAGGPCLPKGISAAYFAKPTIFANVNNDMTIAREEIFGPVLCMMPYKDGAGLAFHAPVSGYKQSGNGREWGEFGFEEFLEVKAVMNTAAA